MEYLPKDLNIIIISYLNDIRSIDDLLNFSSKLNLELNNNDWITIFRLNVEEYYHPNIRNYKAREVYYGYLIYRNYIQLGMPTKPNQKIQDLYLFYKYIYLSDLPINFDREVLIKMDDLDIFKKLIDSDEYIYIFELIEYNAARSLKYVLSNNVYNQDDVIDVVTINYLESSISDEIHIILLDYMKNIDDSIILKVLLNLSRPNERFIPDFIEILPEIMTPEMLEYIEPYFRVGYPINYLSLRSLVEKYNLMEVFGVPLFIHYYRKLIQGNDNPSVNIVRSITYLANLEPIKNYILSDSFNDG